MKPTFEPSLTRCAFATWRGVDGIKYGARIHSRIQRGLSLYKEFNRELNASRLLSLCSSARPPRCVFAICMSVLESNSHMMSAGTYHDATHLLDRHALAEQVDCQDSCRHEENAAVTVPLDAFLQ